MSHDLSGTPESMTIIQLAEAIELHLEFLCSIGERHLITQDILEMPLGVEKLQKLDELCAKVSTSEEPDALELDEWLSKITNPEN